MIASFSIRDFDDLVTWMYVTIDDLWQQIAPLYRRPGPAPSSCSDSELLTVAVVNSLRGWEKETHLATDWAPFTHLFPRLPERSRYNRRRRNLWRAFNQIRLIVVSLLDVSFDGQCVVDSMPIPVVGFHLARSRSRDWDVNDADFGHCESKKQVFFGYRLHLVVTLGGLILDVALTNPKADEREVADTMLRARGGGVYYGDKGYVDDEWAKELREQAGVEMIAMRRKNQIVQLPEELQRQMARVRQIIETVNSQLVEQMHIQRHYAHTFLGLCARLYSKLTAHTLCILLNRQLGEEHWLRIAQLVYPQPAPAFSN